MNTYVSTSPIFVLKVVFEKEHVGAMCMCVCVYMWKLPVSKYKNC